ncbi:MATE family efflux transporter [Halobaculum sp. D14]|uniref:MATE family efflux transporter n=1 Tax=unclassified Halobaculum TaxID=2640896 RepID=UPI003EBCDEB3
MFDVSTEEITEGSLGKALAFLSIPLVAQQFALVAQQVVDVFWLGRLSGDAVAAVGLTAPMIGLLAAVVGAVYTGEHVLVSQRVGNGDGDGARRTVFHALLAAVGSMAVLAVVANLVALDVTRLFNPGDDVARLAAVYLGAMAVAYLVSSVSDVFEYGFLGAGDSRTPLAMNLVAIGVNIVLDPFFIFGWSVFPRLGIAGAAYATLVGYAVGGLLGIAVALSAYGGFDFDGGAVDVDVAEFRELVTVGAPKAGQSIARQVARLVVVSIISVTGGAAALAAYTVGARVATVAFVPAIGLSQASTTLVGQNLGADRADRATRATWLGVGAATVGLGALGALQWAFPGVIVDLFIPGADAETVRYALLYLQILALGYWALGAIYAVEAGFNGAGRTEVSMYSTMLQYWAVRVPVAAVGAFALGYGALGPFWAVTVSNVVAAVGLCGYFRYSTGSGLHERAADDAGDSSGTAAD